MRLKVLLFILFLFCSGQVFAGNIVEDVIDSKISLSNIVYSNKTEALLLKTGQTTSYHADDDGALELGIAHSFTVLTTGQYAGSTNVTINSLTRVTSNACVQDNNTGDMWHREVIQADIGPATNGKLFWEQYTLAAETCTCNATNKTITADAGTPFSTGALCAGRIFTILGSATGNNATFTVTNITTSVITVSETVVDEASIALDFATVGDLIWDLKDQANANSLAGYSDWRIPNMWELCSILDIGNCDPAIDTAVFPSVPVSFFWSSSTNPCLPTNGIRVYFYDGRIYYSPKVSDKYPIRLVR
jgi:hypothetical protein